jgi:hypothetical protein
VQITARSDRDLTPENIVQKVADASGAKYSAGSTAGPTPAGPPPAIASKPVFNPTRSTGSSGFNPLASSSSRPRPGHGNSNVDEDGWGADAPPVVRSQLEKVAPAYQPTKVNMAELTKQKEPSRFNGGSRENEGPSDVVRGGYQPVGKVDIAAIRAQAQKKEDDRPTIVKGAYEPVGKVDIAAIRARAQKPSDDGARQISPATTGASATSNKSDEPKSLADRSSAFTQSERLTSLPKPKVANKFGSGAAFTGTKAPTPGAFGLQSSPATIVSPPIGAASRTFADEGGKTPAQIWAEKKARQRGLSGAGDTAPSITSPIKSQASGGGEWKSGYSGKSWAPVAINTTGRSGTGSIGQQRTGEETHEQEEAPTSPAGGVGALRDRFKGGAPMGAPTIPRETTGEQSPPPPPVNTSNRPPIGVPMPGLPTRPRPSNDDEDQAGPNIPPPPRVQRSPTPPTPERSPSPARIAMPVARSKEPEIEPPEERNSPPALPTNIGRNLPHEDELTEEPEGHDPARGAGAAVAEASFGQHETTNQGSAVSGKRAIVQYDYEKAEDNELELVEGEEVTNIEMVDEDWWMGMNQKGESGLFPSNYVELVEEEEAPAPVTQQPAPVPAPRPAPAAAPSGPTASAVYDYEAAEDNELSFPEGATVTGLVRDFSSLS